MRLMIDIPDKTYRMIKANKYDYGDMNIIIRNGIPLDKIKAEIEEEKECAYADFEEYKVEYLGQDWEDAPDSLPQDDFRYGMERCIEILNSNLFSKEQCHEDKETDSEVDR